MVDSKNLYLLADGCYQSGARYHFSVERQNNQAHRYSGTVFIEHSANVISLLQAPACSFAIHYNADDLDYGLLFPLLEAPDSGFVRYIIYRSFWGQLFYTAMQDDKPLEAAVAQSHFQPKSDVEILLFFSLDKRSDQFIADCFAYVSEYCDRAGWNCKIVNSQKEGSRFLRLIIPLGGEDENNNNFQLIELDKRVPLKIAKSGVRKKGSRGANSILHFPSLVLKVSDSEAFKPVDIDQNPNDYCALIMSSADDTSNVWIFPRQSSQWKHEEPNNADDFTAIVEMQNQFAMSPLQASKMLLMALKGCFHTPDENSYDKVQTYLRQLGYNVQNMPSDHYCGWHAIAHWLNHQRPDLAQIITGGTENLRGQSAFDYFSNQAQQMVLNGDNREVIRSMASEMTGSGTQRTWLDYRHLRYLLPPFIQQNILIFDMTPDHPVSGLPFQVDLFSPGEDIARLESREAVVRAIHENPNAVMLLHSEDHWLLIMPDNHLNAIAPESHTDTNALLNVQPAQQFDELRALIRAIDLRVPSLGNIQQ